jgi:Uma2 family endonuclease
MHEPTDLLEPDDLIAMPDGDSYELVDGRLVEKPMGAESDLMAATVLTLLNNFVKPQQLGYVFGSQTAFRCFPTRPRLVRKPDVSFVARGRFVNEAVPKGDILVPPDLAVEVVSPNDTYEEVEAKVNEYLGAGVRLVWVISPTCRTVLIRRPDKSAAVLDSGDTLSGENALPGFTCPVADIFA